MMNLNHLMVVLAVAEHGSVGRAAVALSLSQPAVSRTVKELEGHLDVRLFERNPRGVRLTEAGRALVAHARTVRDETLQVEQLVAGLRGAAHARLTVGISYVAPDAIFAHALHKLLAAHPGAHVEVLRRPAPELVERLGRGEIDLVFTNAPTSSDNVARPSAQIDVAALYLDEMVVIAGTRHPLARRRRVEVATLADQAWVLWPQNTPARREVDETFRAHQVAPPTPRVEVDSLSLLLALVEASDLLTVVPRALACHGAAAKRVGIVRVAWRPTGRLGLVLWPRGRRHGILAAALLAGVRDACTRLEVPLSPG